MQQIFRPETTDGRREALVFMILNLTFVPRLATEASGPIDVSTGCFCRFRNHTPSD
jgi:hypothetical protein